MNRWLGGVLVCWLLHAVHGEPLPVCFTKPQHQQHFNGRWLPLKPTETVRLSPVRVCGCRWVLTVVAWAGTVHSSTNRAATRTGCCSIGSRPEGGQGGTATTQGLHRLRGGLGGGRALPRACACHLSSHTDSGPSNRPAHTRGGRGARRGTSASSTSNTVDCQMSSHARGSVTCTTRIACRRQRGPS